MSEELKQKARYIINDFHLGTLVAIDTGNDSFEKTEKAKDWVVDKFMELLTQALQKRDMQIIEIIKKHRGAHPVWDTLKKEIINSNN